MLELIRTSRRGLLLGAAAAGCAGSTLFRSLAQAADARPVSMRLDYLYQGPNGGFVVAADKGFYKDVGLDVKVGPGKGGGNTAQLVASKAVDFGFADGFVVGNAVAKGLDIRMVGAVYRRNPAAVVVLDDSVIKTPKDLEGKTVALSAGGGTFQQWPAYIAGCDLDVKKIRVVTLDPAGLVPALLTGRVDAIVGFMQSQAPSIQSRSDKKARALWYADCGVSIVSNGIIVHNDTIKSDPDLVRKFVAASLKGFLFGRQHVDELAQIVHQYSPETETSVTKAQTEWSWQTWFTPNTAGKPLGWMSEKDWQTTVDLLGKTENVTGLSPEQCYTNEFVPMDASYIPPQL